MAKEYRGLYSTEVFKAKSLDIISRVADYRDLNAYENYQPFFLYKAMLYDVWQSVRLLEA